MKKRWLPYCNDHVVHDCALAIAANLRLNPKYLAVRVGSTIVENGKKYSKVFVAPKDLN
jgi:hypothetical protein